jgi:hypothetical protein
MEESDFRKLTDILETKHFVTDVNELRLVLSSAGLFIP